MIKKHILLTLATILLLTATKATAMSNLTAAHNDSTLTATPTNAGVDLRFNLNHPQDMVWCIVERSSDLEAWEDIRDIDVVAGENGYLITDADPTGGLTYYRLLTINSDGHFQFSKPIAVITTQTKTIHIFSDANVKASFNIQLPANSAAQIEIRNKSGQLIYQVSAKELTRFNIVLPGKGYVVSVVNDGKRVNI